MISEPLNEKISQGQLTTQERRAAREAEPRIRRLLESEISIAGESSVAALEFQLAGASEDSVEVVTLPLSALRLLDAILEANANGHAVTVTPVRGELTPNQAAEMLGVSRPYLIKLLNEGKIAFRRVGTHRRIRAEALSRYQEQEEQRQLETLAALQAQAQELGMGY